MFGELSNSGAAPALELLLRFASQRQRILAANVANIGTPGYQMKDVSVSAFQEQLNKAVEERRRKGSTGPLELEDSQEVEMKDGELVLKAREVNTGMRFHDGSNRDIERMMQAQVENSTVFRVTAELLKSKYDMMRSAIAERV